MGNPLVNELIIGTAKKDLWNATDPKTRPRSSTSIATRAWRWR